MKKKEHISFLFLPHIPFTSFGDIAPLNNPIYLLLNLKEILKTVSLVEVQEKVVKAAVMEHVEEIALEVVESVVVEHQYEIEMVPLLVVFLLEQLQLDQQKMC